MKKIIILLICICLTLTSCSLGNNVINNEISIVDVIFRTDDYVCYTVLVDIVESIENKDKELLLSIFSENAKEECENIEAQVDSLFDYCSGKLVSFGEFNGLPEVHTHYSYGDIEETMYPTYDINTSDGSYRIYFKYVSIDTVNRDNKGLWSLYVIKAEDDVDISYAYTGDGEDATGIHLGLVYEEFDNNYF